MTIEKIKEFDAAQLNKARAQQAVSEMNPRNHLAAVAHLEGRLAALSQAAEIVRAKEESMVKLKEQIDELTKLVEAKIDQGEN